MEKFNYPSGRGCQSRSLADTHRNDTISETYTPVSASTAERADALSAASFSVSNSTRASSTIEGAIDFNKMSLKLLQLMAWIMFLEIS